jgi:hypothetical protein
VEGYLLEASSHRYCLANTLYLPLLPTRLMPGRKQPIERTTCWVRLMSSRRKEVEQRDIFKKDLIDSQVIVDEKV